MPPTPAERLARTAAPVPEREIPESPKGVNAMVRAMIICPKTGKAVPSGFTFGDLTSFDSATLVNNYVQCASCGEMHLVDNSTVRVFPSEDLRAN